MMTLSDQKNYVQTVQMAKTPKSNLTDQAKVSLMAVCSSPLKMGQIPRKGEMVDPMTSTRMMEIGFIRW